jgi:hypothetical protein
VLAAATTTWCKTQLYFMQKSMNTEFLIVGTIGLASGETFHWLGAREDIT